MCRLFGLASSPQRVRATFWLLEAPDSLTDQSRRDPDGTGLGYFEPDGTPVVRKAPIAAYADRQFAEAAQTASSSTFIAHVRYATTGGLQERNTHPFSAHGRMLAHNGVIEGMDLLERHLGSSMDEVRGDTDSERFFALVNRETEAAGGDVTTGLETAARWVAGHLPLFALNIVMISGEDLWALRYPDAHGLYVLDRQAGGQHGRRHLDQAGSDGRLRVHADDLSDAASVVVASERLDEDPAWRLLRSGELLHVSPGPGITSRVVLPDPPAHRLSPADLTSGATVAPDVF
ncbi:class II glutamine amidotransferase [Catenulispora sp. NL8]|uniref:Class II glutamine amidotransferase n=1 Tax=Catenulispora pinistramenti TaxID=2705254 RepID=A0ABS5KL69_9ACTN|nr:class II glutamine amidotransferase [Catenulispora pinistramenti]MBS2546774.1 class II glutamine amidotransferase [Catenulispora pinistramenti]